MTIFETIMARLSSGDGDYPVVISASDAEILVALGASFVESNDEEPRLLVEWPLLSGGVYCMGVA